MNSLIKSYIKLFLAISFWASVFQIAPFTLSYVDVYLVGLIRYFFASLIFILVHYFFTKRFFPQLNIKQWLYIIAVGFFGIFSYNITFLLAEKFISANIVAIIGAFTPCVMTVLSSYIFSIKVNKQAKIGILIALLGTVGVILFSGDAASSEYSNNTNTNFGKIFSVLTILCFSAYAILGKYCVREKIQMITINAYGAVIGMLMFAIISLFKSDFSQLAHTDVKFWVSMLYIAIFATVVAYVWYLGALEEIGVYKTAVFQNTVPFLVILMGFIFYGETISILALLFGSVVFLGVYITNIAVSKK